MSDVDRAKRFYESLGWRLDADFAGGDGLAGGADDTSRLAVLHPLRQGNHDGSAGLGHRICISWSSDIEAARAELIARGADVSEAFHFTGASGGPRVPGRDPNGRSYGTYATFSDPDGNSWLLQEIKTRLPGRGLSNLDVATLTELLREAEKHHGEYEADRSEAPLVGLVRRLHRRARAGEDSRGGGQGWARSTWKRTRR